MTTFVQAPADTSASPRPATTGRHGARATTRRRMIDRIIAELNRAA